MWWITTALILAGIIFMLVELLLIPGVGIGGFLSLAALGAACWYTFAYIGYTAGWWVLSCTLVLLVVCIVFSLRARTWKKFELSTEITSKVNVESSRVRAGDRGVAKTRLAPMGTGKFGDVSLEVKSENGSLVDAGTPIEVVSVEDNQVTVKSITEQ